MYSIIEDVQTINEIRHPSIREGLKFMQIAGGVEIHHDGDLPARAGLGSSSSFTVGLLNALHALRGEMPTRIQLAMEAIHIERDLITENVGSQDQVTASFGGLNHITIAAGDKITIQPITATMERIQLLQSHLMLFFTGLSRTASEIAAEQIKNTPNRKPELHAMRALVDDAIKILTAQGDIRDFGKLLHEGWKLKRSITARISNKHVDDIYEQALAAGAIGGKLLGAGGGGFMLLFVEPDKQAGMCKKLAHLLHVPFAFESLGSQIIFYEPSPASASPGKI